MNSPTGFPPLTVYDVVDVTMEVPGVVTVSSVAEDGAFFLTNGMTITFSGVNGMTQLNRNRYILGGLDVNTLTFRLFDLEYKPVNTGLYSPYSSGGQVNIVSYPPQAGSPPGLMYNTQPITI